MKRKLNGVSCLFNIDYHFDKVFRYFVLVSACLTALGICGCQSSPRRRLGCYPTSTPGTRFINANKLGTHSYGFNPFENNGIIYTCRGGHIDITHLRIGADNTRFVANKLYKTILAKKEGFSFGLAGDQSRHVVRINYPAGWDGAGQEAVAREVSLQLGQYLAFSATTWHEMLTWYGYRTMAVFPEFSSAFSWEDTYSNLLGTHVAVKALRDREHSYNKALTLALNEEIEKLKGQSARVARNAAEQTRGDWFKGNLLVSIAKRNLDIGLDDGYITPMIVPGVCDNARVLLYPVPTANVLRHGFSIDYEIQPKEFEKDKLLRIIHPVGNGKTVKPMAHFVKIMAEIRRSAIKKIGSDVDVAYVTEDVLESERFESAVTSRFHTGDSQNISSEISMLIRRLKTRMSN